MASITLTKLLQIRLETLSLNVDALIASCMSNIISNIILYVSTYFFELPMDVALFSTGGRRFISCTDKLRARYT
jgi:hypothetical protein